MRLTSFFIPLLLLLNFSVQAQSLNNFRDEYVQKTKKEFPNSEQAFYPENEALNVWADFKKIKNGKIISIPTSGTKIKDYMEYAKVKFKYNGKKQELTVYRSSPVLPLYKDHLFLLLKDQTAPEETYGGGRYLDLSTKDFEGKKVNIDFNKLYNPYCAFSEGWNCPIPPKNNHLKIRLEAGEKVPLKTEYDHE